MNLLRSNIKVYPATWEYNFLNDQEIEKIIEYSKKIEPIDAIVGQFHANEEKEKKKFTIDSHIKDINSGVVPRSRQSIVRWFANNEEIDWLFKKIINSIRKTNHENFDYILKYFEDLQFTEYNEVQKSFYGKHYDCDKNDDIYNYIDIRKLSFSIQLSDPKDYEGGELILYDDKSKKIMPKEKGTIIFFSSDFLHEVTPVLKGTRYSIVSWVRGPNLR